MLSQENLASMQKIAPFRHERLFNDFLPKGYELTTLSHVKDLKEVIRLKVILGTLITLYDDFADRPDRFNPSLLSVLYRVPFEKTRVERMLLSELEQDSLNLSEKLFKELYLGMMQLPHYQSLIKLFQFDLKQFFLANEYSEFLTENPALMNEKENKLYLHHNMGIVMAGMIDLMSLESYSMSELGQMRSLFLMGQRAGRISNVLATYERELKEGDHTNELMSHDLKIEDLNLEFNQLIKEMERVELSSFSTKKYQEGIMALHQLHVNLKGVI
tara:strand:+ start:222058 stop:222876 length:819 start_codon:yes stop_codon:yes gene_type:complete